MKITIQLTFIECILSFIAGLIVMNVASARWEDEPIQVIACVLSMILIILFPRFIISIINLYKD